MGMHMRKCPKILLSLVAIAISLAMLPSASVQSAALPDWNGTTAASMKTDTLTDPASRARDARKIADFILSLQNTDGAIVDAAGWTSCNTDSTMMYALMGLGAAYEAFGDARYLEGLEKGISWLAGIQTMDDSIWRGSFPYSAEPDGTPIAAAEGTDIADIRGVGATSALFVHLLQLDRTLNPASPLPTEYRENAIAALDFLLDRNRLPSGFFCSSWQKDEAGTWTRLEVCYAADQADDWLGLAAGARLYGLARFSKAATELDSTVHDRFWLDSERRYAVCIDESGVPDSSADGFEAEFPQGYLPLVFGNNMKSRMSLTWLFDRMSGARQAGSRAAGQRYAISAALLLSGGVADEDKYQVLQHEDDKSSVGPTEAGLLQMESWLRRVCMKSDGGVLDDGKPDSPCFGNVAAFSLIALLNRQSDSTSSESGSSDSASGSSGILAASPLASGPLDTGVLARGIDAKPGHPVVGTHCTVTDEDSAAALLEDLPRLAEKGVNLLIVEVGYGYRYTSHPELASDWGLTFETARRISAECQSFGIRVVPEINCLGHQSWEEDTDRLLTVYPQFDETIGLYPNNEGIYCRSWCPLNPDVNGVVFDLMDELIDAFEADAFHVGMDEVFLIGTDGCPNCRGKDPGELFAKAVNDFHDHLVDEKGVQMFLWGDRLLDGFELGAYSEWESSFNGTHRAIDLIPRDIVVCDWHYGDEPTYPSISHLLDRGFQVLTCSYEDVAATRALVDATLAAREENLNLLGHVYTSWGGTGNESLSEWPTLVETIGSLR